MFRHIGLTPKERLTFTFEGRAVDGVAGESLSSALLAAGEIVFRASPVSGADRGPFCMMGVCFECLVEVDGVANRQACMITIREGMVVRRQRAVGAGS